MTVATVTGADTFDYSEYEKLFPIIKESHDEIGRISGVYCDYIKQLIREKRIGSATKYRDSYNVIKNFGGNMYFQHITVEWLRSFEGWMLDKGRSRATVGGFYVICGAYLTRPITKKLLIKECAIHSEGASTKFQRERNERGHWNWLTLKRYISANAPVIRKLMPKPYGFSCISVMR